MPADRRHADVQVTRSLDQNVGSGLLGIRWRARIGVKSKFIFYILATYI